VEENRGFSLMAKKEKKHDAVGIWAKLGFKGAIYVMYAIIFTLMVIPLLHPLGLPTGVSEYTRAYKETVDSVPDGGVMLVFVEVEPGSEVSAGIPLIDTLKHAIEKRLKIVAVTCFDPIFSLVGEGLFSKIDWEGAGYVYGRDYVYIGYIPGEESAMAALYSDFRGMVTEDYYGHPASDLPLVQQIRDHRDIDIAVLATASTRAAPAFARQWPSEPGRPSVICTHIMGMGLPYYPDIFKGMVVGTKGAAEYEYLLGKPGPAIVGTDLLTLGQGFMLAIIIVTNLIYFIKRKAGE